MKLIAFALLAFASLSAFAGASVFAQTASSDAAWTDNLPASDDRYTNPKSPLYNGPNGWFGTGRVLAVVENAGKTRYDYKASFVLTNAMFVGVEAGRLHLIQLDFGVERPAPGIHRAGAKADPATRTVRVSFDDVSGQKLRGWTSAANAGAVAVSEVNGFLYFKLRDVRLQPVGLHNTGDMKAGMTIGFEGALKPRS